MFEKTTIHLFYIKFYIKRKKYYTRKTKTGKYEPVFIEDRPTLNKRSKVLHFNGTQLLSLVEPATPQLIGRCHTLRIAVRLRLRQVVLRHKLKILLYTSPLLTDCTTQVPHQFQTYGDIISETCRQVRTRECCVQHTGQQLPPAFATVIRSDTVQQGQRFPVILSVRIFLTHLNHKVEFHTDGLVLPELCNGTTQQRNDDPEVFNLQLFT